MPASSRLCICHALLVAAATLAAQPAPAATEREHVPHVHGVGRLNVAVQDGTVEIELEAPGADIVGFEHPPSTPAERATVNEAIARLSAGEKLFVFPRAAGCKLTDAKVSAGAEDGEEHARAEAHAGSDKDHEEHVREHSEFHAHYRFDCSDASALTGMEVMLFKSFPASRELEVQAITPRGQTSAELTAGNPRLAF